jgi:hypothetical protein
MTIESLDTAHAIVDEDPNGVVAVYEYRHTETGKKLWSVEHRTQVGCTLRSPNVSECRQVYQKGRGWF